MTSNMTFYIHFDVFSSEVCLHRSLPTVPILSFTSVTDHPRVGEILPGCGLQSGMVPVRIPISFLSRAVHSAMAQVLSQASSLALSK
jgi:hypothetical protein